MLLQGRILQQGHQRCCKVGRSVVWASSEGKPKDNGTRGDGGCFGSQVASVAEDQSEMNNIHFTMLHHVHVNDYDTFHFL